MVEKKETFTNNEIYEILKNEIITLKLEPGQYIGEIEISKRFNVSRTPIREVFRHLEYDKLIKIMRTKGTVITPIDFSKILDFMYIREKVETGIIDDIIKNIDVESVANLNLQLLQQKKVIKDCAIDFKTNSLLFFELDNEFHKTIFSIANKASIWEMLTNLMPDYKRFRVLTAEFNSIENLESLYNYHCEILNLLIQKDLDNLKSIFKKHIHTGIEVFSSNITQIEKYFVI